jgi:hypothetical protein
MLDKRNNRLQHLNLAAAFPSSPVGVLTDNASSYVTSKPICSLREMAAIVQLNAVRLSKKCIKAIVLHIAKVQQIWQLTSQLQCYAQAYANRDRLVLVGAHLAVACEPISSNNHTHPLEIITRSRSLLQL